MHLFCDPATVEDAETVAALCGELVRRAGRRLGGDIPHELPGSPLEALGWLEAGAHEVLLARLDQEVVGMAVAKRGRADADEDSHGVIEGIYLRPAYRDLGLRRVILASLARHARHLGWQRLTLPVDSLAAKADPLSFFEANGYKVQGDAAVKAIVLAPCTCRRHSGLEQHPH